MIVRQSDYCRARIQDWKVEQKARICSKPGKNCLRWIASNSQVSVFRRKELEERELRRPEVLCLVGEHPAKSRLKDAPKLGISTEQLQRPGEHRWKVQRVSTAELFLISTYKRHERIIGFADGVVEQAKPVDGRG